MGSSPCFAYGRTFPNVAAPMKEITRLINKQVFGEATYKTQDALAVIDRAHKDRE